MKFEQIVERGKQTLAPWAEKLAARGVNPNHLTWGGAGTALLCGLCVMKGLFLVAFFFGTLSGLMDALDGPVARLQKKETREGALLDSTLDRLSDFFLLAGFLLFYRKRLTINFVLSLLALLGAFLVSYLQARDEAMKLETPVGRMKRAERWVVLLLGLGLSGISRNQIPNFLALGAVAIGANLAAAKRLLGMIETAKSRPPH